jgi:hypothetical protein
MFKKTPAVDPVGIAVLGLCILVGMSLAMAY